MRPDRPVRPKRPVVEDSAICYDGPWTHRDVTAGDVRLHVAESGVGPLVLFAHGFPEFWWSWRHQMRAVAEAGYRAVSVDLRGYGASDKPPRGYDAVTLAEDLHGVIRALGETTATVVGHDWGGHLAWTLAAVHPEVVERLVVVSIPHPMVWLRALATDRSQRHASRYIRFFQLPWAPERWIVADDAAHIETLMASWAGPAFPDPVTARRCRDGMQVLYAPHRAMEYYRWSVRSVLRTDGRRYRQRMRRRVTAPTLQIHGELDRCVLPRTARRSSRWATGRYEWLTVPGVGHFPHEEDPATVDAALLRWLRDT